MVANDPTKKAELSDEGLLKFMEQHGVEGTKRENMTEMALDFTKIIRIFSTGSNKKIEEKLEKFFSCLSEIANHDDYEDCHRSFCEWFTHEVRTAKKKLRNGEIQSSQQSSYGQAAKVLDIAIKVYVYYCTQPTLEIAQRIVPFLHSAIDRSIINFLKHNSSDIKIRATAIKDIKNETEYQNIQSVMLTKSSVLNIHPVQYEDILWRYLNRRKNPH